jgi:3-oxoacyl-[acyl-carrier protein] reductase
VDLQLAGLKAVVTGGSRGIGAAIVRALASEGCHVSFCARGQDQVTAMLGTVQSLPGHVVAKSLDVTDSVQFEAWLSDLAACDIFIPTVSALSGNWDAALRVDVQATVGNTEAIVPYLMRSKYGAITYIGSKAGSLSAPTSPGYAPGRRPWLIT